MTMAFVEAAWVCCTIHNYSIQQTTWYQSSRTPQKTPTHALMGYCLMVNNSNFDWCRFTQVEKATVEWFFLGKWLTISRWWGWNNHIEHVKGNLWLEVKVCCKGMIETFSWFILLHFYYGFLCFVRDVIFLCHFCLFCCFINVVLICSCLFCLLCVTLQKYVFTDY